MEGKIRGQLVIVPVAKVLYTCDCRIQCQLFLLFTLQRLPIFFPSQFAKTGEILLHEQ